MPTTSSLLIQAPRLVHNSHRLSPRRERPRKRSPAVRHLTTGTASIARAAAFARNLWPAPSECASGSRSKPCRWGFSVVTNQLEQVLLHDRESERGNQFINPHAADLCLQEEL